MNNYRLEIDQNISNIAAEANKFRERKPTLLKLQWVAERARKCEDLKRRIKEGSYHVDSKDIARALLNIS